MRIELDEQKNASNREKHGLPLSAARELDWMTVFSRPDRRRQYGEDREIGYGLIGRRLCCVVFVRIEEDLIRIISLRKANSREVRAYEEIRDHQADPP